MTQTKQKNFVFFMLLLMMFFVALEEAVASPIHPDLVKARDAICNADFATAESIISNYISANTKDPYGYLMRGISLDWKQMVNGLYQKYDKKILDDFDKARILAEVAHEEDHNNLDKKIALGHSLMYLSKKMIDVGQSFRAGGYLKRAKDIMTYVQLQQPDNPEVDLSFGVFYYFSANIPKNLKWAASLLGFSGDAPKGLLHMKKAALHNNFSRGDAEYLLVYTLYKYEKDFALAQNHNDQLRKRYPNNPEFDFLHAEIAYRKKDFREAIMRFGDFDSSCSAKNCAKRYAFLSHYFQADSFKNLNDEMNLLKQAELALNFDTGQENSRVVSLHKIFLDAAKKRNDTKTVCERFAAIEKLQKYNVEVWSQVDGQYPECVATP